MKYEIYRQRRLLGRADWRWRLVAGNGRVIATSGEGYRNRDDMEDSLDLVRGSAQVRIVDLTKGQGK